MCWKNRSAGLKVGSGDRAGEVHRATWCLRAAESANQPCSCSVKVFWIQAVHSSLCISAVPLVLQRPVPSPLDTSKAEQGLCRAGCRRLPHDGCGGDAAGL